MMVEEKYVLRANAVTLTYGDKASNARLPDSCSYEHSVQVHDNEATIQIDIDTDDMDWRWDDDKRRFWPRPSICLTREDAAGWARVLTYYAEHGELPPMDEWSTGWS